MGAVPIKRLLPRGAYGFRHEVRGGSQGLRRSGAGIVPPRRLMRVGEVRGVLLVACRYLRGRGRVGGLKRFGAPVIYHADQKGAQFTSEAVTGDIRRGDVRVAKTIGVGCALLTARGKDEHVTLLIHRHKTSPLPAIAGSDPAGIGAQEQGPCGWSCEWLLHAQFGFWRVAYRRTRPFTVAQGGNLQVHGGSGSGPF